MTVERDGRLLLETLLLQADPRLRFLMLAVQRFLAVSRPLPHALPSLLGAWSFPKFGIDLYPVPCFSLIWPRLNVLSK